MSSSAAFSSQKTQKRKMDEKEDGYIYYEFVEKKSSSIHYKTWVCMGEVIVSESKPEVRYYNHQPLGNNRYLRYSTYHSTKLNNIKADEKEQKSKDMSS
jgi:hypothetical protein